MKGCEILNKRHIKYISVFVALVFLIFGVFTSVYAMDLVKGETTWEEIKTDDTNSWALIRIYDRGSIWTYIGYEGVVEPNTSIDNYCYYYSDTSSNCLRAAYRSDTGSITTYQNLDLAYQNFNQVYNTSGELYEEYRTDTYLQFERGFSWDENVITESNRLVFNTEEEALAYLESGDYSAAAYIPDSLLCPSPYDCYLYKDNHNENLVTASWKQQDIFDTMLTDVYIYYSIETEQLTESGTIPIKSKFVPSEFNKVSYDVSSILDKVLLRDNDTDIIYITFVIKNLDSSGVKQDSITSLIMKYTYGQTYWGNGSLDDEGGANNWELKTETDFIASGGITWNDSTSITASSDDLASNIASGFGLLGNSGFLLLVGETFAFVPVSVWTLIIASISSLFIVGLFKLLLR